MSLFPAYFGKRRDQEPAPVVEPDLENESRADVFNLIPPRAAEKYERPKDVELPKLEISGSTVEGRNVHTVGTMDLTRLSIDNDGRLYWDGKPVEVQRRLMLTRRQTIGAAVATFFIVVAAIGSAIQATATLSDWSCRTGWSSSCGTPGSSAPPARSRSEIPA